MCKTRTKTKGDQLMTPALETIEIIALGIIIPFKLVMMFIAIYQIKKQEKHENNHNNPPDTYDMSGTNN